MIFPLDVLKKKVKQEIEKHLVRQENLLLYETYATKVRIVYVDGDVQEFDETKAISLSLLNQILKRYFNGKGIKECYWKVI